MEIEVKSLESAIQELFHSRLLVLSPTFCGMRSQPPINPTSHDERRSSSLDIFLLIRAQIKRQFRRRQRVRRERVAAKAEIERGVSF